MKLKHDMRVSSFGFNCNLRRCDEGVACALVSPLAQVELHADDVPFLDYIITDIHGHVQVYLSPLN